MRRRCNRILFLLLLSGALMAPTGMAVAEKRERPHASRGILDLRGWDLERQGSVKLDGEWLFYWRQLYHPLELNRSLPPAADGLQLVPGLWNGSRMGGVALPGDGYATYRLTVLLQPGCCSRISADHHPAVRAENSPEQRLGLRFKFVETAFTAYLNGRRSASAGSVGTSAGTSQPAYKPQTVTFPVDGDRLEIVIQVSNFHHQKAGLHSSVELGCEANVRESQQFSLYKDVFLFGSIFMMGIFHLAIFWLWKKDLAPLFFGLLCVVISLRAIVVGDYFILQVFPALPWEFLLKVEYSTFIWPTAIFSWFLVVLYPGEISQEATRLFTGVVMLLFVFILLTPVRTFSHINRPYQVIVLIWAVYLFYVMVMSFVRRRMGSRFVFAGFLALFLTGVNDILYNNLILKTGMLFPVGMFFFTLMQAIVLSQKAAAAYYTADQLSTSLDLEVKQRTGELLTSNNQLKQLLHILCHDLQNPLANIQNIIHLSRTDQKLYTEMVPYAAASVENGLAIIELVRELRGLEEKKLELTLEPLPLGEMLEASERMLSQRISEKSIRLEKEIDNSCKVLAERTSFVNSVLNNILTNAIKFSQAGSSVRITAECRNEQVLLVVRDFGIGMPPKILDDLFSLNKSTSRYGTAGETGTGFGMPLVKNFVSAYGGAIEVHSRENGKDRGTEIRLILRSA